VQPDLHVDGLSTRAVASTAKINVKYIARIKDIFKNLFI
jgi:hypothetical protein